MEQGAQSIYRAVAVLRELASRNSEGTGMTELSDATGLTGPTVHRILRALVDVGLAYQRTADRRYFLGQLIYELALNLGNRFDLGAVAASATGKLAELTGDTAFFLYRSGGEMVCLNRTSGSFPVKTLLTDVGTRRPLGLGAGGLAVLAKLPREAALKIMTANEQTYLDNGQSLATVIDEVEKAADLGHVVRRLPELGATTVAVAICDQQHQPFAALSASAISQRMEGEHLVQAVAEMKKLRDEIEAGIG